jgi:hypothetical protein
MPPECQLAGTSQTGNGSLDQARVRSIRTRSAALRGFILAVGSRTGSFASTLTTPDAVTEPAGKSYGNAPPLMKGYSRARDPGVIDRNIDQRLIASDRAAHEGAVVDRWRRRDRAHRWTVRSSEDLMRPNHFSSYRRRPSRMKTFHVAVL